MALCAWSNCRKPAGPIFAPEPFPRPSLTISKWRSYSCCADIGNIFRAQGELEGGDPLGFNTSAVIAAHDAVSPHAFAKSYNNCSQPPVNPALHRPSTMSGHFFINSQRNPVRWFSIINTIGP